jgi:hypothetical protein
LDPSFDSRDILVMIIYKSIDKNIEVMCTTDKSVFYGRENLCRLTRPNEEYQSIRKSNELAGLATLITFDNSVNKIMYLKMMTHCIVGN